MNPCLLRCPAWGIHVSVGVVLILLCTICRLEEERSLGTVPVVIIYYVSPLSEFIFTNPAGLLKLPK